MEEQTKLEKAKNWCKDHSKVIIGTVLGFAGGTILVLLANNSNQEKVLIEAGDDLNELDVDPDLKSVFTGFNGLSYSAGYAHVNQDGFCKVSELQDYVNSKLEDPDRKIKSTDNVVGLVITAKRE